MARAVLPGVAHHLTQRGVNRGLIFRTDSDHYVYLDLVRRAAERSGVSLHRASRVFIARVARSRLKGS